MCVRIFLRGDIMTAVHQAASSQEHSNSTDSHALDRLKSKPHWVAWKYVQRGNGKPTKPPVSPVHGRLASIGKPSDWTSYEKAKTFQEREGLPGIGYVLTRDDNITGADLDNVRDPVSGVVQPWAQELIDLHETYCEISPSGAGLRFFMTDAIEGAVKNDLQSVWSYIVKDVT